MDKTIGGLLLIGFIIILFIRAAIIGLIVVGFIIAIAVMSYVLSYIVDYIENKRMIKITNPMADPLLTECAELSINENLTYKDLIKRYFITEERAKHILSQLTLAGLIIDGKAAHQSKKDRKKIYKEINNDFNFFYNRIEENIAEIITIIDKQRKTEKDPNCMLLLKKYKESIGSLIWLKYLQLEKNSLSSRRLSVKEINNKIIRYNDNIRRNHANISIPKNIETSFASFSLTLKVLLYKKIWNTQHSRLMTGKGSFWGTTINNQKIEVPFIKYKGEYYYFYPTFVLINNKYSNNVLFRIEYYDNITIHLHDIITAKENWFDSMDATAQYKSFLHTCLDGTPDMRYNNNPQITYYKFYNIVFTKIDMNFLCGSYIVSKEIERKFNLHKNEVTRRGKIQKEAEPQNSSNPYKKQEQVSELRTRIIEIIKTYNIKATTISQQTLVETLNDYQAFQTIEEKSYAKILKAAIKDGTMQKILDHSLSSLEGKHAIKLFILSNGYDKQKVTEIISAVYYGFNLT